MRVLYNAFTNIWKDGIWPPTKNRVDGAVCPILELEMGNRKYDAVRNRKARARIKVVNFDRLAPFHADDIESLRGEQK